MFLKSEMRVCIVFATKRGTYVYKVISDSENMQLSSVFAIILAVLLEQE